jgi:predicted RNA methylase
MGKTAKVRRVSAKHLSFAAKTNLGSFYTPKRIAKKLYETLAKVVAPDQIDVLLEPNCGYGALLEGEYVKRIKKVIGADIDESATAIAKNAFSFVCFKNANALKNVSRSNYGINENDRLLIVANPPYNDLTSQIKNGVKKMAYEIDRDLLTRDLGLSSLLGFNRLRPDFIAVLHPLSYLIKKTNFNALKPFMKNYALKEALIFNSQEFCDASKLNGFPVLIAIYQKSERGTSYDDIYHWRFNAIEGESFTMAQFDYIGAYLDKYPNKKKKNSKYLFYTMRDINALKRSRTFIKEEIANAVHICEEKLDYYCYVDIFKDYADRLPYYMGNLDVPIDRERFELLRESFRALSVAKHRKIFGNKIEPPTLDILRRAKADVQIYFNELLNRKRNAN